jgi:UDP-N-acetyl-D-mannosaminuronic acid transferase (WecB/TagA/CpsF family)
MSARQTEQILGISFFHGTPAEAVKRVRENGGLVVAPSGTCFQRLLEDGDYRRALTTADVALADSGFMVLLWRIFQRRCVTRISGYAYLQELLRTSDLISSGADRKQCDVDHSPRGEQRKLRAMPHSTLRDIVWVLPHERAREKLLAWSHGSGVVAIADSDCYVAPLYPRAVNDERLLDLVRERQPRHVVIAIGAGAQEKLGAYLRDNVAAPLGIHCIGGALGFITGDQVAIPRLGRSSVSWLVPAAC